MTSATYADGSVHSYVYDAEGNRSQSSISDTTGTRTWEYAFDNRNRLAQETKPDGSTLAYQYDAASNKTQLVTTLANGDSQSISYSYDALNRLASVTNAEGTSTYGYDEVGNRTSLSYPNGASQTWNYDTRNRLTKTSIYNSSGALIQSFDYTLHPTGRRTQIAELGGRTSDYTYNDRYWLTSESITDNVNGNYSASYQYDAVGNRTQGTEAGITTSYSYDDNDRLVQQGGVFYTYDANGNTLQEDDQGTPTFYGWNSLNQLVEHTAGGVTSQYEYNSEGVRHSQTNPIMSTDYLVDSNRSYAQVLAETVDGATDVVYHFGDDLISQDRDSGTHYFHVDGLGSTRVLTDTSGTSTDSYAYAAFGEVLNQSGLTENDYLYTGEQFDEGLGQHYLRARYYDQGFGLFTSTDTWMGRIQDPVTLNKYLYAANDPIIYIDPTGNSFTLGSIGRAIGIGAVLATSTSAGIRSLAIFNPRGSGARNWSPDLDGRIDIWEAAYWWCNGGGGAQSVPLTSIDLSRINASDFNSKGLLNPNFDLNPRFMSNLSDAAVYGTINLEIVAGTTVKEFDGLDIFDFDQHKLPGGIGKNIETIARNVATGFAGVSIGKGQPFNIAITGTALVDP